jgi:hypothetical protein
MAAVICSATATAALTCPSVVLVAEWVVVPSGEAGSAIIATAVLAVAAALSELPGCEFAVFAFGMSADVARRPAAFGDFSPVAAVGDMRWRWPGVGVR